MTGISLFSPTTKILLTYNTCIYNYFNCVR